MWTVLSLITKIISKAWSIVLKAFYFLYVCEVKVMEVYNIHISFYHNILKILQTKNVRKVSLNAVREHLNMNVTYTVKRSMIKYTEQQ